MSISGLILAGGKGRRVGGRDKGLLEYQGQVLVERQIEWLKPQVDTIFISASRNCREYKKYKYSLVTDESPEYSGPLYGVLAGLKCCHSEWLFVHPVDMPGLPTDTVERIQKSLLPNRRVYFLASPTRSHYLSLFIHCSEIFSLENFLHNSDSHGRVKDFLTNVGAVKLQLGFSEEQFLNLNSNEDFAMSENC